MKLLLDENLPKELKDELPGHNVYTVREKGWNSKLDGELLQLMIADGFDALLTFDKNIAFQQNFKRFPIPVLVLYAKTNQPASLIELAPSIRRALNSNLKPGVNTVRR